MPPINPKNFSLSPAGADLGLSEQLGQQLDGMLTDEEERRKKLKEGQSNDPAKFGDSVMGPAALSLFSGFTK